jgi:23S rRNA (uridine2552-2'-O)-methyltransferase
LLVNSCETRFDLICSGAKTLTKHEAFQVGRKYKRKDHYYKQAQEDGYRSRAAYKILELNKRYRLVSRGSKVLDLGAWPGSWLQILGEAVGEQGIAIGIDLVEIESVESSSTVTLVGDAREPEAIKSCIEAAGGGKFDCIVSDMAPKLTGIRDRDEMLVRQCVEAAIDAAHQALRPGGNFVVKMFRSSELDAFAKTLHRFFRTTSRTVLDSTRTSSNEVFFVGRGYIPENDISTNEQA